MPEISLALDSPVVARLYPGTAVEANDKDTGRQSATEGSCMLDILIVVGQMTIDHRK
jgi:hypothetical protein